MMVIAEGCLLVLTSTHESLITFHYILYIAPSPHTWQTNTNTRAVAGATICQQSRKKGCESHCKSVFSKNQSRTRSKFRTSSAQFTHHKKIEQNVGDSTDTLVVKFICSSHGSLITIVWATKFGSTVRSCIYHRELDIVTILDVYTSQE